MAKRALGKGLDALIQSGDEQQGSSGAVTMIALDRISPNPEQPRKTFDEDALEELTESIRAKGVIQPIIVEERDGDYVIVAGERRFRAAGRAGLREIPVVVAAYSAEEREIISLIENVQREDLNPIEEAAAYRSILTRTGINQDDLAREIGKKRSTIANSLRLLKLPEDMQSALRNGDMTAGHARAVLSVGSEDGRRRLFEMITGDGISVRSAEQEADRLSDVPVAEDESDGASDAGGPETADRGERDPELDGIERRLMERLGTKVKVRGELERGMIEIGYYSMEDLERILDLLSVGEEQ